MKKSGPPKARVCYICGRQYMLHSFEIHVAQCKDLFEKRENLKPLKERRKCPTDPTIGLQSNLGNGSTLSRKDLDALNAASQQVWTAESLVKCQFCNRSFLPEKIKVHNKSCTADNPARRVEEPVNRRIMDNALSLGFGGHATQSSSRFDEGIAFQGEGDYMDMVQCKDCGRRFNNNSFMKHSKVCRKVFSQKRKPFDSAKARAKGTELADFQRAHRTRNSASRSKCTGGASQSSHQQQESSALPKWKADSLAFRQAMRAAKMVSKAEAQSKATGVPLHVILNAADRASGGGMMGGGGYGSPQVDASYIQCPTCGRSFNQKAGERHIPQCKNIINKPSRLLSRSGQPSYSSHTASPSAVSTSSALRSSNGTARQRSSFGGDTLDRFDYQAPHVQPSQRNQGYSGTFSGMTASKVYAPNDAVTVTRNHGYDRNSGSRGGSGFDGDLRGAVRRDGLLDMFAEQRESRNGMRGIGNRPAFTTDFSTGFDSGAGEEPFQLQNRVRRDSSNRSNLTGDRVGVDRTEYGDSSATSRFGQAPPPRQEERRALSGGARRMYTPESSNIRNPILGEAPSSTVRNASIRAGASSSLSSGAADYTQKTHSSGGLRTAGGGRSTTGVSGPAERSSGWPY